ncbi:MAG: diaminopimelate epimerase, partial [Firmicutes bacterium]|nr:diaminopimelate epimerase [Bacillota bacterium]
TGSMVTVLTLKGKVSGSGVRVGMTGGELIIDVEHGEDGKTIENLYLTGPTNIVAKGEVTDEDLCI